MVLDDFQLLMKIDAKLFRCSSVYNLIDLYFLRVVIKLVLIFFVLVIENQVSQSKGIYVFFFFNFIVATDSCIIAEAAGKAHVNEHWNPLKLLCNLQIRLGLIVRCSWVGPCSSYGCAHRFSFRDFIPTAMDVIISFTCLIFILLKSNS